VFGASVRLAERGKPEAVNGSEHAARKGLTILKAVGKAMKHEHGAFKVKIEQLRNVPGTAAGEQKSRALPTV
jgi:hypothetical protein